MSASQTIRIEVDRDIIVDAVARRLDSICGAGEAAPRREPPEPEIDYKEE